MPRTQITGEQVDDGSIKRDDLNIDESGQAVIRKLIAGTGINLSSTGVDAGTGDVTVNTQPDTNLILYTAGRTSRIGGFFSGSGYMSTEGVVHTDIGFYVPISMTMLAFVFLVNVVDASRSYTLDLLANPAGTGTIVYTSTLPVNTLQIVNPTSLVLGANRYGIRITKNGFGQGTWTRALAAVAVRFNT